MNIHGIKVQNLTVHADSRGSVTEIFRDEWVDHRPVQWNRVCSGAGVLRGVHAHFRHTDYLFMVDGSAIIGLKDMRPGSPTLGCSDVLELTAESASALVIPTGVAHAFYFPEPAILVYGVTHYWDKEDELGCRWDDPALGIRWPFSSAILSERDEKLPDFATFSAAIQEKLGAPRHLEANAGR